MASPAPRRRWRVADMPTCLAARGVGAAARREEERAQAPVNTHLKFPN